MSEMIERVASAMAENMNGGMFNSPRFYNGAQRELWLARARIAIEAMREPTEGMVDEADSTITKCLYEPVETPRADMIWREMIDVALERGP